MFNVRLAGGHLYGKQLFTWLSLVVSFMASFVLSFFPLDVLDEIWDLIESVSKGISYLLLLDLWYIAVTIITTFENSKGHNQTAHVDQGCISSTLYMLLLDNLYPLGQREVLFSAFCFNQVMKIPTCKLWSHEAYWRCVSEDSTGICPTGMPYGFTCPEIVVIYRLHAGGLQGFFVSTVCGSVWASNTRTEPIRDLHDDFENW